MRNFLKTIRDKFLLNAIRNIVQANNVIFEEKIGNIYESIEYIKSTQEKFLKEISDKSLFNSTDLYKRLDCLSYDLNGVLCTRISRLFSVYDTHSKVFPQFKNINKEKSVAIVGAGPSLNDFTPIENCIYVGLNRAFKFDKIKFKYLFAIDKNGIKDYYDDFFNYRNGDCIKFIGDQNIGVEYQIPESKISGKNIYRYFTTAGDFLPRFTYHINTEPIGNFVTVSLQAMQFALYTNPKKIYLVGIDCTPNGHFTGKTEFTENRTEEEFKNNMLHSIEDWRKLKEFAQTYYPDTEIISVNPVGLKGIFKDWYQSEGEEPK